MKKSSISRRKFFGTAAAAGAAGIIAPAIITGCSSNKAEVFTPVPEKNWLDQAPDGPVLKAGIIGCGGRGSGAAINFLDAGPNLQITALADTFRDRLDQCRAGILKQKGQEVPEENCFVGFDAYQKVIDSGVDVIITASPPYFRPEVIAAAVAARKHIFAEKPICVDPVGARSVMASALKAKEMGLTIVTGTQRRHQRNFVNTFDQIKAGAIGDIVGGNFWWNGGKLWHRDKNPAWSEMEWMVRDWVNWTWLSGDHIVEQHVHNLDVMQWFFGTHPIAARGMGSRQRRVTGDQFDNFAIEYVFENGTRVHSQCRQINGCWNQEANRVQGTKGSSNCQDTVLDLAGNQIWKYTYPKNEQGEEQPRMMKPAMDQEHVDFVTSIRNNEAFNELENTAISTLIAIMGRVSAYTGKEVTWEEMMNSDMKLGPKVFAFGPVDIPKEVPAPGEAYDPIAERRRAEERAAAAKKRAANPPATS